jgi:hypothetical protein
VLLQQELFLIYIRRGVGDITNDYLEHVDEGTERKQYEKDSRKMKQNNDNNTNYYNEYKNQPDGVHNDFEFKGSSRLPKIWSVSMELRSP